MGSRPTPGCVATCAIGTANRTPVASENLRIHARRQLNAVFRLQLRQLVIAGATILPRRRSRLPRARTGPSAHRLAGAIERLAPRGLLPVSDPRRATSDFNWLVMADLLNRAMFLGNDVPEPAATTRWVDHGVRRFLAA